MCIGFMQQDSKVPGSDPTQCQLGRLSAFKVRRLKALHMAGNLHRFGEAFKVSFVYVFFAAAVPAGGGVAPAGATSRALVGVLLWTSSSPRPSPQVAPAAATSVSAWQALKFYSGEGAGGILNNAQCCDLENESLPLQRENRWAMRVS